MSIYITKEGTKKKVNISATDVQLLDIDGRFKSKNLEDALKEVGSGTEENMTRIENKVEQLSNPNLLINGDFQVNQKGEQTYINSGGHKYTVDRWNCWSANGKTGTIQKQDDGILCTLDDECRIRQAIELPPQMQNQYVTLSFEGSVTQGECWVSIMASDSIGDYSQSISFGSVSCNDNKKLTVKVTQLKKYLVVDFFTKVRGTIKLKWVKLEVGTVATPFVPRHYGEELALCKRYYEISNHDCYISGVKDHMSYFVEYKYDVEKRVQPTIECGNGITSGQMYLFAPNNLKMLQVSSINPDTKKVRISLPIQNNDQLSIGNTCGITGWIKMDAEIY